MYLIVIAWMYVVLMMSIAEATSTTGTLLGAIMTFLLYGLLPLALVMYLMRSPARWRALKAREAAEVRSAQQPPSDQPDAGGHAAGGTAAVAETAVEAGVTPVRKEP